MFKKTCTLLGLFLMFNAPFLTLAQTNDTVQAILDAKLDVQEPWRLLGCLGKLDIVLPTQKITPALPAQRLIGKSPEYVVNYTQTYQSGQVTNQQTGLKASLKYFALAACCLGVIVGYYYIEAKSAASVWD